MAKLRRVLGPLSLSVYGIGVTIGAGIYALTGEIAGLAGDWAPVAFLTACIAAGFSALSYAELATRHPESAGEGAYVAHGLRSRFLSILTGYGVALSGLISSAAILRGFAGYFTEFAALPAPGVMMGVLAILTLAALWGVREAVWAAGIVTVIEVAGLIFVVVAGLPDALASPALITLTTAPPFAGFAAAVSLAFFAFVGFEDIVNMAEEAKRPERTLPIAIGATLGAALILYALIAWVSVSAIGPQSLADSPAPLARVAEAGLGPTAGEVLAGIALIAMVNGVLVQILMASRVLYGMAKRGAGPTWMTAVHPQRRTPHVATLIVAGVVAALALAAPLATLAQGTVFVVLVVFTLVNAALIAEKRRGEAGDHPHFTAPFWAPVTGLIISVVLFGVSIIGLFG
jgi:amino acid transporter